MHPEATRSEIRALVAAGTNDCEIARRTGVPRTTVRDIRRGRAGADRPTCPRCWRATRPMWFSPGEYAELLGLYLGDGHISALARTERLRLSLDARHLQIVSDAVALLRRCFGSNATGVVRADDGATAVVWTYSRHLSCLFRQHGPGKKHHRRIELEPWQSQLVELAPWSFLRGCVHSDGCFFINRTGRYRYLSVDFHNESGDILDLFCIACDRVGAKHRRYARRVRIYDRPSVREFAVHVGSKR